VTYIKDFEIDISHTSIEKLPKNINLDKNIQTKIEKVFQIYAKQVKILNNWIIIFLFQFLETFRKNRKFRNINRKQFNK
jgi:hypothetical protein